ncbi:MAG: hypothetical protein FWH21_07735 [Kiritimatiellaeota bacterium]|nr:hypothetical protein [Kiritimatiellota bacterium]
MNDTYERTVSDDHAGGTRRQPGLTDTFKSLAEAIVLILLLPQIFLFLYFFWRTVTIGIDGLGMMKELFRLGLHASQVGAPFIYLLYFLIRHVNRGGGRYLATFLICAVAGYGGVLAWNRYIFENFSYFWSIIPVLICSGGATGFMLLRDKEREMPSYGGELFLAKE